MMRVKMRIALILLTFVCWEGFCQDDQDDDNNNNLTSLQCNSSHGLFTFEEGGLLEICPRRNEQLLGFPVILSITGTNHKSEGDFVNNTTILEAHKKCIVLQTLEDEIVEGLEKFLITLRIERRPDIRPVPCPAVIIDNDENYADEIPVPVCALCLVSGHYVPVVGAASKCRDILVHNTSNQLTLAPQRCAPTMNLNQCEETARPFLSCSNVNKSSISSLLNPNTTSVISTHFRSLANTLQRRIEFCTEEVQKVLSLVFMNFSTIEEADQEDNSCYTNCSITLMQSCSRATVIYLSRFSLEETMSITTGTTQISDACGSVEVKCCSQDLPQSCFPVASVPILGNNDDSQRFQPSSLSEEGTAGLIAGAVSGLLLMVIATALFVALLICCIKRRKIQQVNAERSSTNSTVDVSSRQSVVYKPKRQGSSAAVSNVSQDSNSMALDNSIDTTITHLPAGNYEQVAYTDSEPYSQWKLRFSKVLVSAERLDFGRIIGEGEFSLVCRATYFSVVTDSPMQVAVKKLKGVSDNYEIEKFIAESEIMLHLDHPNILNLMGVCFNMTNNLPAIVLPYMDNGDLRKFLLTKRGQMCDSKDNFPEGLNQSILLGMCMDIARGMHYLAQCKLVHRDLAARNCMVGDDIKIKIADFGLSRDVQHTNYYKLTHRQKLPVKWMAPESLFKNIFSEKSDVWSYGIVCWEIFKLGKKPYSGIENQELPDYVSHGYRPKKPSRCPSAMYEIMRDTWSEEPEDRPIFRTIVKSLANIVKYEGNIEDDLDKETADCKTHHSYLNVDFSSIAQNRAQRDRNSQPDEPVYSVCSQEDNALKIPMEYEVPVSASQTSDIISVLPMDYEVPHPHRGRKPRNASRPSSVEPRSHSRQASPFVTGASSRPPSRPSSRHSVRSVKIPISGSIPISSSIPIDDPRRGGNHDPDKSVPPYSKLNYRRGSTASTSSNRIFNSVPTTTDKPYSTLEWTSSQPTPLPPPTHHYHTLDYSLSDQL